MSLDILGAIKDLDPDNEKHELEIGPFGHLFREYFRCKPGCVLTGAHRVPIDCYVPPSK